MPQNTAHPNNAGSSLKENIPFWVGHAAGWENKEVYLMNSTGMPACDHERGYRIKSLIIEKELFPKAQREVSKSRWDL